MAVVVAIEEIERLIAQVRAFDSLSLDDILFTERGIPICIPQSVRDEWSTVGMSNKAFVEMRFWEPASQEELRQFTEGADDVEAGRLHDHEDIKRELENDDDN